MQSSETHHSLILRIRDPQDVQAWTEFTEIYEPLVYRLARRFGLQDADAREATQEVLLHLIEAVGHWQPDRARGTFRGWLYRVSRNVMIRFMERQQIHPPATGGTSQLYKLAQLPAADHGNVFDIEFKRQVFVWASDRARAEFERRTWDAFWETFVDGRPVAEFAATHGISPGAVYIARCRVLKRLRDLVRQRLRQDRQDLSVDEWDEV